MTDTKAGSDRLEGVGGNHASPLEFGRLLRAGTSGFVVGCRANQMATPSLGALVRVPLGTQDTVFGLVQEIHIDDDGLIRQLATSERLDESIVADNRYNRLVPLEISVLSVGYQENGRIYHLLPPRPPLSLTKIYLCSREEICAFTAGGRFGYFRHILRAEEIPVAELLAAHLRQAAAAHKEQGNPQWIHAATQEIIILLRDDYATLTTVLNALGDAIPDTW